jgi:hypothetical protein
MDGPILASLCGGINKEVIEDMALREGSSHILLLKCRKYLLFNCTVMQDIIFSKKPKSFHIQWHIFAYRR